MGKPWLDQPAWELVPRAEAILGASIAPLLLDERPDVFASTREVQLAIFVQSLVVWSAAEAHVGPVAVFAGHSLGQLTALVAAGALTLEDGLRLVERRAELTQAAARRGGGMVALLGATPDQAAQLTSRCPQLWIANDNGAGQIVVAGSDEGVEAAMEAAREIGVRRAVRLDVPGAFHTPLMAEAAEAFAAEVASVPLAEGTTPVVSNTDAAAHRDGGPWRERLVAHLVSPVRWRQTMETIAAMGVDSLLEVGPGAALSGLAKRALPGVSLRTIGSPADVVALAEVSA
jgi:[acyl-carrier-protein] S-malonyltransferase